MRRRRSRPLLYPPSPGLSHLTGDARPHRTYFTRSNGTPGEPNAYTTAVLPSALNPPRHGIARVQDGSAYGYPGQQHETDHEEEDQGEDRVPVAPRELVGEAEEQRAQPAHAPVAHLEGREVLRLLARGHQVGEERAGERLGAAQHGADEGRQHEEPDGRAGRQEVPGGQDQRPHHQRAQDRVPRAVAPG